MIDFHNGIVILGGISFLIIPFLLRVKLLYKLVFIICALSAIGSSFFESSKMVNIIATISLMTPFVISVIKKDTLFIEN